MRHWYHTASVTKFEMNKRCHGRDTQWMSAMLSKGVCGSVLMQLSSVSSGRPVSQHVSAPAASLSQAVISTYHSDRPAREDTGTYNPHSETAFSTLHPSTLLCLSIVFLWLRNCQGLQSQQSVLFCCELLLFQQRGFEASWATERPGKASFQIAGYVPTQRQTAQCDTLKEVEKIKINSDSCRRNALVEN